MGLDAVNFFQVIIYSDFITNFYNDAFPANVLYLQFGLLIPIREDPKRPVYRLQNSDNGRWQSGEPGQYRETAIAE